MSAETSYPMKAMTETPSATQNAELLRSRFGARVRELRRGRRMTLKELASASGVSVSMVSQVERGERVPTLPVAQRIVDALGCYLGDVVDDTKTHATGVLRRENTIGMVDPKTGLRRVLLSRHLPPSQVEVSWYRLPTGTATGPFVHNDPRLLEEVTVIRGRLRVTLGKNIHLLRVGDSISYRGTITHRFENVGRSDCSYIHISHPAHV